MRSRFGVWRSPLARIRVNARLVSGRAAAEWKQSGIPASTSWRTDSARSERGTARRAETLENKDEQSAGNALIEITWRANPAGALSKVGRDVIFLHRLSAACAMVRGRSGDRAYVIIPIELLQITAIIVISIELPQWIISTLINHVGEHNGHFSARRTCPLPLPPPDTRTPDIIP